VSDICSVRQSPAKSIAPIERYILRTTYQADDYLGDLAMLHLAESFEDEDGIVLGHPVGDVLVRVVDGLDERDHLIDLEVAPIYGVEAHQVNL
jgi:hypothetical protein